MKKILLFVVLVFGVAGLVKSQQRFVSFDGTLPTNWMSNSETPLELSTLHVKAGSGALKWHAKKNDYIQASDLGIPSAEVHHATANAARIFIYVPEATADTLLFEFKDENGVVKRTARMLLNYAGWREYHRSYLNDFGTPAPTAFLLDEMQITYRPFNAGDSVTLHIDEATLVGNAEVRIPGPHMWPDYAQFKPQVTNAPYLNILPNWKAGPDMPVVPATATELTDLEVVRSKFIRAIPTPVDTAVTSAKAYVTACNIVTNPDGSLNGRGIPDIYTGTTMMRISTHVSMLARAAAKLNDAEAEAMLVLFTRYLLSEGMAEGGRVVTLTNDYTPARTFSLGFFEGMQFYSDSLKAEVKKMLRWSNEFSVLYGATYTEGYSVDFLNNRMQFLYDLALLEPADSAVRDLKLCKRYMERNTVPSLGGRDGMKPDGTGYHHGSSHISYMSAWGRWIEMAYRVKGTVFRMDLTSYNNISTGIKYLLAGSSKGLNYAHAESGRGPFPLTLPVTILQFEKFVEIGGDIKSVAADPVMGAFYNDVTGTSRFNVAPVSAQGFYQYNYSALGIQRKNKWVAVMRGFTSKIFSAEIYKGENRYGRYQSYGSLEVLYGGSLPATGYVSSGRGWDWNVMPGTTTVHFDNFGGLQPIKTGTAMEFQNLNFAGSLSLGQEGIFGFNFSEKANANYDPSRLLAKKTVFAFDSVLVCLGSSIYAQNGLGNVATNLFQNIDKTLHPAIYINSATAVTDTDYDQTFDIGASSLWLVNAVTTGYFVPQDSGTVRVVRKKQKTPKETVGDPSLPNSYDSAYASKAWINHGLSPSNKRYHYVTVPGTTPAAMQALIPQLTGGTLYQVLRQTDTMHVVKYLPGALTMYVFFKASTAINTGLVKSVSDVCAAAIRGDGDTITLTINGPDMKITTQTAYDYYWLANPRPVNIVLNGNWEVISGSGSVSNANNLTTASFTLEHGLAQTVVLKRSGSLLRKSEQPANEQAYKNEPVLATKQSFRISPNPASSNLVMAFTSPRAGTAEVRVFSTAGTLVQAKRITVGEGAYQHQADVSALPPGTYIVVVEGGNWRERGMFVKQ